jgi:hypothetical protein
VYVSCRYVHYEPQFWWWEVVELLRKLFLCGIIVFIMPDSAVQVGR